MALRNQPYFPLYVQDYLTDEKLSMCSWSTQGIYIKLLCLLHKQKDYGKILFKQNHKQTANTPLEFAKVLIRLLPCELSEMEFAISELLDYEVLQIDGEHLIQKRMVKDGIISEARANAGKKGGGNPNFKKNLFKQNHKQTSKQSSKQNTEDEDEAVIEDVIEFIDLEKKEKEPQKKVAPKKDDTTQFRQFFIELGYDIDLLDEWLLIRKKKRAVNTLTSAKMFHDEVMKTGWDVNRILKIVVTKQWVGFQDDWNWNDTKKQTFGKQEPAEFIWRK